MSVDAADAVTLQPGEELPQNFETKKLIVASASSNPDVLQRLLVRRREFRLMTLSLVSGLPLSPSFASRL